MNKLTNAIIAIGAILMITFTSCKDAQFAQFQALGSKHTITQYGSDGHIIGQWESTGNVNNQEYSDGWYFKDNKTGKLIEVCGTLQIVQE